MKSEADKNKRSSALTHTPVLSSRKPNPRSLLRENT